VGFVRFSNYTSAMPALFFPNLNALRLALASGLVPPEIGRAPAAAGFDIHGRLWLELPAWPPRESLAAMARLGVQALGGTGVPTSPVSCWAELLPLHIATESPTGLVLFLVPDRQIARFVARLRRASPETVGVKLPEHGPQGHGWVTIQRPPAGILGETTEPNSPIEAFAEQAPGVWVRHGWRHPVPDHFPVPAGYILLVRPPRSVVVVAGGVSQPEPNEFRLPRFRTRQHGTPPPAPALPVRVSLAPATSPGRESLWVLDSAVEAAFWSFCATADERLTRKLEAAPIGSGTATRLVVRASRNKKSVIFAPPGAIGYARDARLPGLFVPANRVLRPALRMRELARVLGVGPGLFVWVEPGADGGIVPHSLPEAAFRPIAELLEYTAPPRLTLEVPRHSDPFPLDRFVVMADPIVSLEPEVDLLPVAEPEEETDSVEASEEEPGWLLRSLRRLVARFLPRREEAQPTTPVLPAEPEPEPARAPQRVERTLASADALLHGHDWAPRRRELEGRLFHDLPRSGPEGRAERWADLAAVYSATRKPLDAAICWINAIWEAPNPPVEWLEDWLAAEGRDANLTESVGGLERWLSEPGRRGVGRVVAAYTALAGARATPAPEFLAVLPRVLTFLDQHFDDLPVRAAWLARLAAARMCDGDALGLARWRDRLLSRLAECGPGLDLDEPSFLRFHGTASAERFQTARDWLMKGCPQALKWVDEQERGVGLRFAGLDAETDCTAAYALFMFAWGLGCLGERTRAKQWAAKARKQVARASGPRIDPAAHAVLGDLFLLRVKDAQDGRASKPGLPAILQSRLDELPILARYSVDRLRSRSRILEPIDHVGEFGGLDLKVFWGNDRLGERLLVLTGNAHRNEIAEEADALLELCADSPSSSNVPRVVLTLLEVAPRLTPAAVFNLLDLLPTAIDWLEMWIDAGTWSERPRTVVHYQSRMLESGFTAAGLLPPALAGPDISRLVQRLLALGDSLRAPLLASCSAAFRALRRLGLRGEAEAVVRFLDRGEPEVGSDFSPARLGLAMGWFTAGNDDAGHRILNEAREALFLGAKMNVADRTSLAIAYAEALGFAPPGIAHGRLQELFERLGRVKVDGGTVLYYTLQPLRLIDAVVRSVVTDEFTLGPAVRGWLDDDEFLIRCRIHRDLAAVLREQGIG
jgi:cellulose synthase operon protein C